MTREYFVSYSHVATNGSGFGFGQTTLNLDGPMTAAAFRQVHDYLREQNPGMDIIIISFQQLEPSAPVTAPEQETTTA